MAKSSRDSSIFTSKLPVWYQLATLLRGDILSGKLADGAQLESELQLAETYGVSVMPVRQALKSLEAEGLLMRQRGRGTFVTSTNRTGGFTTLESLYSAEFDTPPRILDSGRIATPAAMHDAGVIDTEVCFLRRIALKNDAPWSYGHLYFLTGFEAEVTTERLAKYPLYRILEDRCGLTLRWSNFTVRATAASPEVARHLGIDVLSPVLHMIAVTHDASDRVVGAFDMSFACDRHTFRFDVPHRAPVSR